ncbi:MAG: ATP synthase subunit I [Methylophaga sp.]|uniref:ATP synthase subunit I n=1 Tax=Methylophaga sp. TaxID=2024840 RepID=UPI00299D9F0C|nr:ATP synthase subunit I [Methylophaga sp.]MDX1749388.1 ATP synthase subunit I [Methylophaga sp.]
MNEFMSPVFALPLALLAGALLGVFFFAGLWWTVRKLESTNHVALLFLGSMLLRSGVVILGLYFILGDNWQRLAAGLLGFVIARIIIIRLTRITEQSKNTITAGGS